MADKEKKKSRKERQRELRMLEKEISGGKSLIDYGKVNQVSPAHAGNCWRATPTTPSPAVLFFVRFQTTGRESVGGVGGSCLSLCLNARGRRCYCFPKLRARARATVECVSAWISLVRCLPAGSEDRAARLLSRIGFRLCRQ